MNSLRPTMFKSATATKTRRRSALVKVRTDTGDDGKVTAIVAVTGNLDDGGDIIVPGAYAGSLDVVVPKGVDSHDWSEPIAKVLDAYELLPGDDRLPSSLKDLGYGAIVFDYQFNLATDDGDRAFQNVKFFGAEQEWSIGYDCPEGGAIVVKAGDARIPSDLPASTLRAIKDSRWPVRLLTKIVVYEGSPVLFGMNRLTSTLSLKSRDAIVDRETRRKENGRKFWPAVPGSIEAQRQSVAEAARAWAHTRFGGVNPDGSRMDVWVMVEATFADHVVICVGRDGEDDEYYSIPYVIDDAGDVTLGDPVAVDVVMTVRPKGGTSDAVKDLEVAVSYIAASDTVDADRVRRAHDALGKILNVDSVDGTGRDDNGSQPDPMTKTHAEIMQMRRDRDFALLGIRDVV